MNYKIDEYIRDRNKAMLAYPNTDKLDEIVNKYTMYFDFEYRESWKKASPRVKIKTLEKMIEQWPEAPEELRARIKEIRAEEEKSESGLLEEE